MDGRTVPADARSELVKLATRLLLEKSGEAQARGLADPLLVAIDGAPGLIRAVEEVFPRSLRQRCLAHKIRNLQQKVPPDKAIEAVTRGSSRRWAYPQRTKTRRIV